MNAPPRRYTGRGALSNPPGRFDTREVSAVDNGWYMEEEPDSIATTLEPERARSVISTNDSPDVPFEKSINPYRGCANACTYCGWGETPVLMADGRTRRLDKLRVGDEIYGTRRVGVYRRFVRSRVLAHWSVIKPAFRTTLEDGTTLVTSGDHRFLSDRGWKFVTGTEQGKSRRPHLTTSNKLMGTGAFAEAVSQDEDYRRGYLCGMIRGDGHIGVQEYLRSNGSAGRLYQFRLALCDMDALVRARNYLLDFDISTCGFVFQAAAGARRTLHAIRASSSSRVNSIYRLIARPPAPTREWRAGFLAGIFDAEGSFSQTVLRISNTDSRIIVWIGECLRAFGFRFVVEHRDFETRKPIDVVRLTGGLKEHLRFFHTVSPAISRKLDITGQALKSDARLKVVSIEPLKAMRLYDITTETGDFIANGVVSHNCYARPSHAYMGLSPGLDFETRLFYKADAAQRLEEELARPGYVCKPITLGANTDPYQPVERRMGVTRSILEVLSRTRHPVTVITKSALVLRDLDLLADMARARLASVAVSVTTLDDELKRRMEPRAAAPQARLRVLRELRAAGVPAGVLIAPVIPALTDHEMEDILAASAAAGARWAGYVLLRLPYQIKDLFSEWLAEHFPERAAHVMSLVRDMRGGRENDPRFGFRMRGTGPYALLLRDRFKLACGRVGLTSAGRDGLNTADFRPPPRAAAQLCLEL
ncbi:MAG TPA: PA0069 family radical SAM protein [Steroidobacteraceae bacterium]|jgi:DNA repair photolyase|nr:PA0069 family radical SAM protein [Steroidobacteraceae bacterium]